MNLSKSFFYRYSQISILFCVLFYDFLGGQLGFEYIDEILLVVLLFYTCTKARLTKEQRYFVYIYIFYVVYSLIWGVACKEAIFTDAIIYLKPFVGFYGAYSLGFSLNEKQKTKLARQVIIIFCIVLAITVINYNWMITSFMGHPSRLATLFQILGIIYLFCSKRQKKNLFITFVIWAAAMLAGRSKSYSFFAVALFFFYYINPKRLEKISISTIISVLVGLCLVFIVAWEKFQFYFITGSSSDISESFARPALYQGALLTLRDFIPLGPGFGSYACYASSIYYSPLYYEYGLDRVQGLSESNGNFISDTYFPQLAQFGILGIAFFFVFFYKRYKQTIFYYKCNKDECLMKMSILIIFFLMIESAVDSTFVQNRGMVIMVIWGMIMNESRAKKANYYDL